jgi:hypothetical protein
MRLKAVNLVGDHPSEVLRKSKNNFRRCIMKLLSQQGFRFLYRRVSESRGYPHKSKGKGQFIDGNLEIFELS